MPLLKELQERYTTALKEAEDIRLKYQGSSETMTAEEISRWTQLMDDTDKLQIQIDLDKRHEKAKAWSAASSGTVPLVAALPQVNSENGLKASGELDAEQKAAQKAWTTFLRSGQKGMDYEGLKALAANSGPAGGYVVAPEQFMAELIQQLRDLVFVRQWARVIPMAKAESLGVPTLTAQPADADWTQEIATGNEDTTMAFGKRELTPHPLAKLMKVSMKLLRQSSIDVDALVRDLLAYKFGITEEKAFLTGSGNLQPLGVFTADTNGISTARDVTASSSTAFTADDLISTQYSLKMQYQKTARWVLHRDTMKRVRQLKDGDGNYIWASGLGPGGGFAGTPPSLLQSPYVISEYAPNTFTTGLYVAVYGDFSFYWIADALDMQMQVLDQLYAATNQMGYIGRKETDGAPVLEEAFARLKLA